MEITPLHRWIADKIGVTGAHLTKARLEAYQLGKLQETLQLARNHSVFYRKSLAGLPGENISSLAELTRLPFTTAEDLHQNPLQFLCVSQDQIDRVVTLQTSGTTGEPKRLYFTREDQGLTIDFFQQGMSTLVNPGDKVLILLPGERPGSVGDLLVRGLQQMGAKGIPHGLVRKPGRTLEILKKEEIDALVGIPTQVLSLARYQEQGGRLPVKLKSVLLSTDHVPRAIIHELERSWGCRVFNHYGMTEMGLGGGVECEARAGCHLREADLYFEIIDSKTKEPLPQGETGEIVFTTLTRKGMPLIRYRTGDQGRFISEPCPCGTSLKRLELVKGRLEGERRLTGGVITMEDLDEALFPLEDLTDFQAVILRQEGSEKLQIKVKLAAGCNRDLLEEKIYRALETIPLIKMALQQGKLGIVPGILEQEGSGEVRAVKRSIIDRRGWEGR